MKTTHQGKRYDSEKMELLGEYNHHNNGNYSGTTYLMRASDGTFWSITKSNGQDCYLSSGINCITKDEFIDLLDGCDITDMQETRLVELKLIQIVA